MKPDFARLLTETLSHGELQLLHGIAAEANSRGQSVYMVGGLPRDLLLGRVGADFDLVVEGDAILLARKLAEKFGGTVTAHSRFGTAKWSLGKAGPRAANETGVHPTRFILGNDLDLITARSERYAQPAELPTIAIGTLDDDLQRRDFTINTLAICLDGSRFGELHDIFDALGDIERGIIRVLHPQSFHDDPTRMYRAVRYEQRYGFRIEAGTLATMPGARGLASTISAHRIRRELDRILEEDHAPLMLYRLRELNLLRPIHPSLPMDGSTIRRLNSRGFTHTADAAHLSARNAGWLLWLMDLPAKDITSISSRLHFGRQLEAALFGSSQLRRDLVSLTRKKPSRVTAYLEKLPLIAVLAVYQATEGKKARGMLEKYLTVWRHVRSKATGHDLLKLGIPRGPIYESILRDLRAAWIDGSLTTLPEEQARLQKLLSRLQKGRSAHARRLPSQAIRR